MDAAAGAWATAVGDELVSGPEQAKRVVRVMKSVQYSSFGMAVVLLLRIGQFPIGWIILMPGYFPGCSVSLLLFS